MSKYAAHTSRRSTPQSEQARDDQVRNSAGGFTFQADKWTRLDRFLILGAEGGTYYISERKLTKENARVLDVCAKDDRERLVSTIVAISEEGRAPKQAPCIFSLAYLSGHSDKVVRKLALAGMLRVCRTGTHLFQFLADVEEFRGWGRTLRDAVSAWYLEKTPRNLAYQVVKYRQRGGESHRDTLRRSHARYNSPEMREVIVYAAQNLVNIDEASVPTERTSQYLQVHAGPGFSKWLTDPQDHRRVIAAAEAAKKATSADEIVKLIDEHDLVRECIPTQFLNSVKVWESLLVKMPMFAMVRNLAKMTSIGLVGPMSNASREICERLGNQEAIRKSRIHPIAILLAMTTYSSGHGFRGKLTWNPVPHVVDALDDSFYLAFKNIEPTNKRWLLGLDVSGSMTSCIAGTCLTCAQGAGALAMVTMRTEKEWYCHGFATKFVDLTKGGTFTDDWSRRSKTVSGISAHSRLNDVVETMFAHTFGVTDCSLPMKFAQQNKIPVDVFAVYTDNETWAGTPHPHQALQNYRQKMGIGAKLIVVGMAANKFTIADPNDPGMLDVVGFDASVPAVMADLARH